MTQIVGNVLDVGLGGLHGSLTIWSGYRPSENALIAPRRRQWDVTNGQLPDTVQVLAGPVTIEIDMGLDAYTSFDATVPDQPTVTIQDLFLQGYVWSPYVITQVAEDRERAEAAADRAESAAQDVDAAIDGAADRVVQEVEQDRVLAEAARVAAEAARDHAEGSKTAAAGSATDAAESAAAAAGSAGDAALSAQDAGGSAQDAAGSADDAAGSATTASQAAQVVTDNLAAIEAAPGHAQAAQVARAGAEDARDAAAGSASAASASAAAASGSASDAAGSASDAAGSAAGAASSASGAEDARDAAVAAQSGAESARSGAESARDAADGHADRAEAAANEFGLTATASTGAPGTDATVTLSGDGPAYSLSFTVPRGDKGDRGDDGEVSQAALDAAVASLVDGAPEALDTLSELSTALGDDPNFAATVATQIGERAKTSDVNAALAGKADVGAEDTATWDGVTGKPAEFPPSAHEHTVLDVGGLQAALDGKAATGHTHTWSQISDAPSYSKDMTGDHLVQRASNGHINVPSDAGPLNAVRRLDVDAALDGKASTSHTHTPASLGAVARSGTATTLWAGTAAQYAALADATKNAAGFVAVIMP